MGNASTENATLVAAFRDAAMSVEKKQWCSCCNAINFSTKLVRRKVRMQKIFAKYFMPDEAGLFWWDGCACTEPSTRAPRVIALALMAAMIEAGDA